MDSEQHVVWITTRRIKEGTYEDFRHAWRPKEFPEGMLRAYECFSDDSNEVVGISTWDSFESRERYRLSEIEAARRELWRRSSGREPGLTRAGAEDPGSPRPRLAQRPPVADG
jgi:hypothetical protein